MPARPPNGFLHHLPRTLNKITEMEMLSELKEILTEYLSGDIFIRKDWDKKS